MVSNSTVKHPTSYIHVHKAEAQTCLQSIDRCLQSYIRVHPYIYASMCTYVYALFGEYLARELVLHELYPYMSTIIHSCTHMYIYASMCTSYVISFENLARELVLHELVLQRILIVYGCVAACCIVLQRVAVCYCVLQCVAVCCSVLQCVAVCFSVLQCAAI